MSITIDKNVPLPFRNQKRGVSTAMRKMQVGDSFFVTLTSTSSAHNVAAYVGIKVAVRKEGEGIRVWRIE